MYVACAGPLNAQRTGRYADGIITVGAADEKIAMLLGPVPQGGARGREGSRGHEKQLQVHVSWAPTQEEAGRTPCREWPNGGMPFPKQDIRNPEDFEQMAKLVHIQDFKNRMLISADLESTPPRSSTSSTWASTRSTSTTWGATKRRSSTHSARTSFLICAVLDR